uniref:Uncharacterized protein n=1 Tax=Anguilla anguilla TaxID=7936 RepID=A0A0E9PPC2_ANGAN
MGIVQILMTHLLKQSETSEMVWCLNQ